MCDNNAYYTDIRWQRERVSSTIKNITAAARVCVVIVVVRGVILKIYIHRKGFSSNKILKIIYMIIARFERFLS